MNAAFLPNPAQAAAHLSPSTAWHDRSAQHTVAGFGMRCSLAARKPFLLRIDAKTLEALRRWADDDLRSLNAQVEFLLRRALSDAGRLPKKSSSQGEEQGPKRRQRKQTPE